MRRTCLLPLVIAVCLPVHGGASPGSNRTEFLIYDGTEDINDVWTVHSHYERVTVGLSPDTKAGARSLRIEYPDDELRGKGYQDWWLESQERQVEVRPGETWTASAWVRYENTERIGLEITAQAEGNPMPYWTSGYAAAFGRGDWELLEATAIIPPGCDRILVRLSGTGGTLAWVDNVRLRKGGPRRTASVKPQVKGWSFEGDRVEERLDRGLVARPLEDGRIHVCWRLLRSDPANVAFNVYRAAGAGKPVKLNASPVAAVTDFVDEAASLAVRNVYFVRPVVAGRELEASSLFAVTANPEIKPYYAIRLDQADTTFQKVGIGDLNGDGRYDFVIKTPDINVDPFDRFWRPSETTYRLEAYLSDGTFLWRKDLGWNIETGIWYSPYIVYDFDGDGRAEVAVKMGPAADLRDSEPCAHGLYRAGRVTRGPEYVAILDSLTGEEKARAPWPSRQGLGSYNHYSRNQMAVAYLDGKTPALILARGTYTVNKLAAYQYHDGALEQLWYWDSTHEPGGLFYGQGGHTTHAVDVNGDGRDDIVLGAAVIDHNGNGLWSSGLGHADNVWIGNIDPARRGLELYLGVEGARVKGSVRKGISLWHAATGEMLWGLDRQTFHIHSTGLVSNIDPRFTGMELYSGETGRPERWLHNAKGELLEDERTIDFFPIDTYRNRANETSGSSRRERAGLGPKAVYWDETPEREIVVDALISKYRGRLLADFIEGTQVAWLDLFGDWREEIITSVPGELRIYATPIPARDRRVTLMQDPLYRTGVAHLSMGYGQPPMTSYFIGRTGEHLLPMEPSEEDGPGAGRARPPGDS